MALLFALFFAFLLMKMPVAFCMLCSSMIYSMVHGESLNMILSRAVAGSSSFTLLALGFFILAGNIMNRGGVTDKIFGFCEKLVGWIPGGLGHANVAASVIFAGMSGSAVADAGGLGAIEIKAMTDAGYDEDFAVAVTGASSCIGPIIPPSISAVVFAVASGVSVGKMFMGGIIPGLVMALCLMVYIYIVSKKRHYPCSKFPKARELGKSFISSFPALLTPVIILGGITLGFCTPTEASVVAVVYAMVLGLLSKELKWKDLPGILDDTVVLTMGVLFIVSCANSFGYIITTAQLPQKLATAFLGVITNKYVALIVINLFLLLVGMLMESLSALVILVPILMPVITAVGIDPLHFGVIMILNITIGMLTPPVGMVLFTLTGVSSRSFEQITKAMMPLLAINIIALIIVTFCPPLVTFLPGLLM
ncbi:MAG: TRAP transporter large permease [Lachnospiraceae bacterium]|nr:TRAP transporter large permease [Lachnospiraceae bacterium]